MRQHHFFKKGFSPLVATVLLVVFSVALATVVVNWRASFEIQTEDLCSRVSFSVDYADNVQLCYRSLLDATEFNFIVKNNGREDIDGMSMLVVDGSEKTVHDLQDFSLGQNSLSEVTGLVVDYGFNSINQVYLMPYIKLSGMMHLCPKLFEVERIGECA